MNDLRVGRVIRAVRIRHGWRQADVANRAGVSQQLVAVVEAGRLGEVTVRSLRAVCRVLSIEILLTPRWKGGEVDRLLDREHAAVVEIVATTLRERSWSTLAEYSFSQYGERGSVDLIGWHAGNAALVVVEVKTRIYDVQDLLRRLDRKARLVPALLQRERGWSPRNLGRILVLPRTTANRAVLARHAQTFASALPAETSTVHTWLRRPAGSLGGVWFVAYTNRAGGTPHVVGRQRVRLPSSPSPPDRGEGTARQSRRVSRTSPALLVNDRPVEARGG
jgi:transcriptional regulator with XRE-family HTH domain